MNKKIYTPDIMLDLETVGMRAGCCVLSIGATTWDEKSKFYKKISLHDSKLCGLKEDPETLAWWNRQSMEAREEAFSGTESLRQVLGQFVDWLWSVDSNARVWGNGADFDLPILGGAYAAVQMPVPWKPYNGRCYRTLKNLYPQVKAPARVGVHHNALDDAIFQARHALAIMRAKRDANPIISLKPKE